MKTIDAIDYFDPEAEPRSFGIHLADSVIEQFQSGVGGDVIRVNFQGIKGAASSHFNIFLFQVGNYLGPEALRTRLTFEFGSTPQRNMFLRSFQAVLDSLSATKK